MKSILAATFVILVTAALGMAQAPAASEWKLSDVQLFLWQPMSGTRLGGQEVSEQNVLIEANWTFSNQSPTASGQYIPFPVVTLSFKNGVKSWTAAPIAIGILNQISCAPYYLLDPTGTSSANAIANLKTLGVNIADGTIQMASGMTASLCFAFSVPPRWQEMHLEFAGTSRLIDSTVQVYKPLQVVPSSTGAVAGTLLPPTCNLVEPSYSDAARKAHLQGDLTLAVVIHLDGFVTVDRVVRGLGYGLDEEAQNAVQKWKCTPGSRNGQPVSMQIQVVVKFRLQ